MTGAYILAVSSRLLAEIGNQQVVEILSQVLADLVQGEFMQLQTKQDEEDRFEDYISKSFNKTASLMAYSCQANAVLAEANKEEIQPAAADLHLGLATAPVLFASSEFPQL